MAVAQLTGFPGFQPSSLHLERGGTPGRGALRAFLMLIPLLGLPPGQANTQGGFW